MIIVLGAVRARRGKLDEALKISMEHVLRSRTEAGCIEHGMHRDVEDARRLVFVEKWLDRDALQAHFQIPESRRFVQALQACCAEAPVMNIYDADELS